MSTAGLVPIFLMSNIPVQPFGLDGMNQQAFELSTYSSFYLNTLKGNLSSANFLGEFFWHLTILKSQSIFLISILNFNNLVIEIEK